MEEMEENKNKIAIVGLDCRLPGANNSQEFWENLVNERESLIEFTEEELQRAGVEPQTYKNPNYVKRRGVVKDADTFDAEFFNFTPREAELLDPQHRIFLECAWHALEDSGIDPFETDKRIAVFGGTGSPYHLLDTIENESVLKYANGTSIITSNDKDYVTTRVSYKLNLKGPSVNVQSACSTSMVGVVMGIDSLLNYHSDVVLAGGVTVELPVTKGYMYQEGSLESPDGKCRTFDKDAQGTVFSRGGGVVALKRLEDALEDKDHIYAVILGGAINNDGNRKAGYTAPSVQGQVEVITEALEFSGISPRTISMVEAHGTATQVGDPIEVTSLSKAFAQYTDDKQFCALGSVKTNIGHTDVASGVASLIKASLSLKYGIIPASLNYNEPNPAINFSESPFFVNTQTKDWESTESNPRRVLINSFGVGGTNACIILEEAPKLNEKNEKKHPYDSIFLTAHNKKSLETYCSDLKNYLLSNPKINLNQLAYTSRVARKPLKYKNTFSFKEYEDLIVNLENPTFKSQITDENKEIVFMFPGQGNQFVNMGRELYDNLPLFKECVDYCSSLLEPIINISIKDIIYPIEENLENSKLKIDDTYITQPAIFIISYSVAILMQNYGVHPDKLIGHSVGEYVAAAVSGIMSLEDALKAVAVRGKLVFDLPKGSMLAVLMSEEDLLKILPNELCIAVINSPELVVVSGETEHINSFASKLKVDKIFTKKLPTSHAFHSKMMEPCLDDFREFFESVELNTSNIPVISTVTGEILSPDEAQSREYWINHVINPVRFGKAAEEVLKNDSALYLECGPGQSLESAIKRRLNKEMKHIAISTIQEGNDSVITFDNALGKLWIENVKVDFESRYDSSNYTKLQFPLLPFNRKSYMVEFENKNTKNNTVENAKTPLVEDWLYAPTWKRTASVEFVPKIENTNNELLEKWIVFIDSSFSNLLVEELKSQNQLIYTVQKGNKYEHNGNNFTIRESNIEDYNSIFKLFKDENIELKVIYTWSYTEDSNFEKDITLNNIESQLNLNFYNLLYLEQSIITNNIIDKIRITTLINDGFDVVGNGEIRPEKSLTIGPMKVLYKEHLGIATQLININLGNDSNTQNLIREILKEIKIESDENIVSYVGMNRWVQVFDKISIARGEKAELLKDNGVYIITGGSGGIGRVLTKLISEKTTGSTIIWTGRKEFPERSTWEELLSNKNTDSYYKERIKTILEVEKLGSKVVYYKAEVLDIISMKNTLEDVEQNYGKINGVIHSAGVAGGGVIATIDKERIAPVLNPKVYGTLILRELLKDRDIDFIHLYSSITAILGESGRVDYTSGNSFMDACANTSGWLHCKATVSSINWGQWGLVGMAADWRLEESKKSSQPTTKIIGHNTKNYPMDIEFSQEIGIEKCYKVNIDIDKHWIFNEHLLTGIPTMVGTSFIETLVRWVKLLNKSENFTLIDATFKSPLMIMKNMPRELYLFCEKLTEEKYNFTFKSKESGEGNLENSIWQEHFSGIISFAEIIKPNKVSILELIDSTSNQNDNRHSLIITDNNSKPTLQFSQRWDCKETTYIKENEWITILNLKDEFEEDLNYFHIHPSMLDVATSAHFSSMQIRSNYLPYSYGNVKLYAPFEKEIYVQTKLNSYKTEDNIISFDFMIFNKKGEVITEILDYKFTKLSDIPKGKMESNEKKQNESSVALEDDILPEEGAIVLQNILNVRDLKQIIVYTKDLVRDISESKPNYLRQKRKTKLANIVISSEIDDRPDIDTLYIAPENEIEKSIAIIWTVILGIHKIGTKDTFNSLGGNSLLAIQVLSGIKDEFDVIINADEFVNNPTIFDLSELVLGKILSEHSTEDLEALLNE